jgi:hypothetical protein
MDISNLEKFCKDGLQRHNLPAPIMLKLARCGFPPLPEKIPAYAAKKIKELADPYWFGTNASRTALEDNILNIARAATVFMQELDKAFETYSQTMAGKSPPRKGDIIHVKKHGIFEVIMVNVAPADGRDWLIAVTNKETHRCFGPEEEITIIGKVT